MIFGKEEPPITISTTVSRELWKLKNKYGFKWSEALRRGISIILAEKGVEGFVNELNDLRMKSKNLDSAITRLELLSQENEDLKTELEKIRNAK